MMDQRDWHSALDDILSIVNATGYGAAMHKAISEYHGKTYNKKLNFGLTCGGCGASIYFALDRLYHSHFQKQVSPPAVQCPSCKHSGKHSYDGIVSS